VPVKRWVWWRTGARWGGLCCRSGKTP